MIHIELRILADYYASIKLDGPATALRQAADEIERLQREIKEEQQITANCLAYFADDYS